MTSPRPAGNQASVVTGGAGSESPAIILAIIVVSQLMILDAL
jgi:hypothetical protein